MKQVLEYRYAWDIKHNIGHVRLKLNDGNWTNWKRHDNAVEFQIIITTLRNETPVFLNRNKQGHVFLQTTNESVGENEF